MQVCYNIITARETNPKLKGVFEMKILKKAEQKNFKVDTYYYTKYDIEEMEKRGIIKNIDDYRIFAANCKEVKVICHEGFYTSVAITNSDEQIFIQL